VKDDTIAYVKSKSGWRVVGYVAGGIVFVAGGGLTSCGAWQVGVPMMVIGGGWDILEWYILSKKDNKAMKKIWDDWEKCCIACKKHGEPEMVEDYIKMNRKYRK
jgi:hypothetical protein